MQDPKPAAGNHSTTNPTKSSPSSSPPPPPPHQRRRTPTTDTVNPNPITQNTTAAGGGAVELTGEGGSSAVVAVGAGSSVAKQGPIAGGGSHSMGDEDPLNLKGSLSVSAKRKWELRDTPRGPPKCPVCVHEFPSWKSAFGHLRKHPERTYRDDVGAGQGIDLNLEPTEGKEEKNEVEESLPEVTPMEGVEETSDAAEKKSEEEKRSGAAANENAMEGVECSEADGKTESSDKEKRMKRVVEGKNEKEEGKFKPMASKDKVAPMEGVESSEAKPAQKNEMEGSSSANKDEHKKAFAFDLNELPSDEEGNMP